MVTISTRVKRQDELLAITERFPDVYCSVGTHPHHAHEELDVTAADLVALTQKAEGRRASARPASTIITTTRRATRRSTAFALISRRHVKPACRLSSIRARPTTTWRAFWKKKQGRGAFPAVLHCFTGGADLARRAVALGHFVSFTGILTFKNSQALREIAAELPADRVLVETDAPYLAPGNIAASATSRLLSSRPQKCLPKRAAYRSRRSHGRPRRISSACLQRSRAPHPQTNCSPRR